jgi:hypothetical protein
MINTDCGSWDTNHGDLIEDFGFLKNIQNDI